MECPACGADQAPATECEWCAQAGKVALTALADGEVEAMPERGVVRIAPSAPEAVLMPSGFGARPPRIRAGVGLTARLWSHPAVRAAVRTGVGAVALSMGLRLARGWLARSLARGGPRGMAPSLVDHLPISPVTRRVARDGEIVEAWIYMRQVRGSR
jgi:hypothetical protein